MMRILKSKKKVISWYIWQIAFGTLGLRVPPFEKRCSRESTNQEISMNRFLEHLRLESTRAVASRMRRLVTFKVPGT
jgi:hypothetical protein